MEKLDIPYYERTGKPIKMFYEKTMARRMRWFSTNIYIGAS